LKPESPGEIMKSIATTLMATAAGASFAHEGHGFSGTHWHASDVWGFVVLGGALAVAIWLSRGGK
jgi:hypothetical protein